MKLFKAIFTLSALLAVVGVQARQMYVGNLNFEDKFRQTGTVKDDTVGAAILVSADELQNKVGAELTHLSVYHIGSTAPKYLKLFVTHNLDSVAVYEKEVDVTIVKEGWNTFALDSSLTLTEGPVYLGYYFASSVGASYAVANGSTVSSFVKKGVSADWISTKGIAVYGMVVGENLPAHDVVLSSGVVAIDVEVNKPVNFSFYVENVAADTIKTIEFECDYGNGKKETKLIDIEIPYLGADSLVYEGKQHASE